jgi:hypothetical protein
MDFSKPLHYFRGYSWICWGSKNMHDVISLEIQKSLKKDPDVHTGPTTKKMLTNNTMTLDEGMQLVGELVSAVTYLHNTDIKSIEEIKKLGDETMKHLQMNLNLALEAIQVT